MSIMLKNNGYGTKTYRVTGITTQTDNELIDLCDPCNFGGRVTRHHNNTATVTVYID